MSGATPNPYDVPNIEPVAEQSKSSVPCGCLTVIALAVLAFLFLLPSTRRAPEAARRTQCKNNLKNIALALHNYHEVHKGFPPAYTTDADGNRLHSWRTLILPYLEQQALYDQIDLTVPWDHPRNALAFEAIVPVFQCPSTDLQPGQTTYRALVGENIGLHPTEPRRYRDFIDGTSNCLLLVEVTPASAVHWMDPRDQGNDLFLSTKKGSETAHMGGFQGAMLDGSVRFFSSSTSIESRQAMMTINGGEGMESLYEE